ncbi:hypothetical protein [Thermoactinomyces mirandus]|uniref:Uncharacterized protein n=1 Tax=Thermoactinomyces mirandus TaxID=2756294 RepID=A0A7W2AR89_9BACL|nr:hypothetical protein [Thermoactinomyces mirandus]MBA4601296.1 hypothetical protein [Thermoactinomyces mirandus]
MIPIPLDGPFGSSLNKDKNGSVPFSVFEEMSLVCNLLEGIDVEWDEEEDNYNEEFLEELESYTQELFANYVGKLFDENRGQHFPIPCIIQRTDGLRVYHLQSKQWIDEEDISTLV